MSASSRSAGILSRGCVPGALHAGARTHVGLPILMQRRTVIVFVLALLAVVPFANAIGAGFTFDDEYQIRQNRQVMGGVDVVGIFATPLFPGDLYRPLTTLTFAWNQALAPDDAALCHLINVVLHMAVTFMVAWLAQILFSNRLITLLAGATFAVHPIHTEAVTSLVGRAELLAALGGLGSLVARAGAERATSAAARYACFAVSLLAFCMALASKESALTVLPLLFLLPVVLRGEAWRSGVWRQLASLEWLPYALCGALYLLLRYTVIGRLGSDEIYPLNNMLSIVPMKMRVTSAIALRFDELSQLLAPLVLSADYSHAQVPIVTSWLDLRFLGGVAVLLGAVLIVCAGGAPAFAALLSLITLSLTSNILFPIGTIRAERLLYLPSAGWAILLAVAVAELHRRVAAKRWILAVFSVWLLLLAGRTWVRNYDWADEITFHSSTVRTAPASAKAHYNYGIALKLQGQKRAAMHHLLLSHRIFPWSPTAPFSIARLFDDIRAYERAEYWYGRATQISPPFIDAHANLCRNRLLRGRYAEAARACRAGLRFDPLHSEMLKGLAGSFFGLGHTDEALILLRRVATIAPGDAGVRANIAALEKIQADAVQP